MNKISIFFTFFAIFICLPLFGKERSFSPKEIEAITVKAVHLDLKTRRSHSDSWKIKWSGNLSFHLEEGLLTITSDDFDSKKAWQSSSSRPVLSLEISGPSVPVEVFSFSSQNSFVSWTKPVFISSFKGSVKGSKNKGSWVLSLKEGQIDIHQHQGSLSVKGFRLNHFLSSSRGRFLFHINEGKLQITKSEGTVGFTTNKAEIKLTQFKGKLKGFSQSGEIKAVVQPEDVDLFSGEGALRLSFMGGWSPKITAYTEKGRIYGPKYLYKKFSGKSTELSGRLRGANRKGKVVLRSDTGNIYIR